MIKLQGRSQIMTSDEKLVGRKIRIEYVDGKPLRRPSPEYVITCNVQPLNGRELLLVPEGDRYKEQYNIFTESQLEVDDEVIRYDQLKKCNANFTIQAVEPWGTYYKARIMRIDTGPEATP